MSVQRPTAKQLLDAARVLGVFVAVVDDQLIIKGASPQAAATLHRHRRALVRRILAGRGAA